MSNLLPESQQRKLAQALMASQGNATEEEINVLLQWAERVRREALMVDMILDGSIIPSVENGEVAVKAKP